MLGELCPSTAEPRIADALASLGFAPIARVLDSQHVTDFAIGLSANRLSVVRCVARVAPPDHTAVATMISQGDFIWGAIVYSESAEPDPMGLIECFHVDELDQLVSRLNELRGVLDEAR